MSEFDFSSLDKLIELAGDGARAGNAAIDLLKRIKTAFKSPQAAGNAEFEGLVIELMNEVTDTKLANLALKEQLIALREQALQTKAREDQFSRYELWKTPYGTLVYRLKHPATDQEPDHYLCATCKEKGIKSILQGHNDFRQCNVCKSGFRFNDQVF